jgi:uncharacterized delta-60 repeat protein/uncharacterized repeat protein (TIGR01451 family)
MFKPVPLLTTLLATLFLQVFAASVDPTFTTLDMGVPPAVIVVQPDGKILAGGSFGKVGSTPRLALARLLNNGNLDTDFNTGIGFQLISPPVIFNGQVLSPGGTNGGNINAIAVQADGKVLAGGAFTHFNSKAQNSLVRLNADGSLDTTFTPALKDSVSAILISTSGKILIAGAKPATGSRLTSVLRLNSNGTIDTSFIDASIGLSGASAGSMMFAPGEKPVFLGGYANSSVQATYGVFRLNVDGGLDSAFKTGVGSPVSSALQKLSVYPDGRILVGLSPNATYNGTVVSNLMRLNSDGSVDTAYHVKSQIPVSSSIPLPDGRAYAFGLFDGIISSAATGLARLNADGSRDTTYGVLSGALNGALQADGKLLVSSSLLVGVNPIWGVVRIADSAPAGPVITAQPIGIAIPEGATRTLSVTATGNAPLAYQWQLNGTNIAGAIGSTLSLSNFKASQAGKYKVIVSNGGGSTTSAEVEVTIILPARITVQPVSVSVTPGQPATFTVTASGSQPITYQWRFNFENIPNATNSTFTVPAAQAKDVGGYTVLVHNAAGEESSFTGNLTLKGSSVIITQQPVDQTILAVQPLACGTIAEGNLAGATLTATIRGGAAPFATTGTYQIKFAPTGRTYSIAASGAIPAVSGAWSFGEDLGISTVITLNGYMTTGRAAKMAVLPDCTYELYTAGVIANQNGTLAMTPGSAPSNPPVTFSVAATSDTALSYQWKFNGTNIAGATSPTLTINNPQTANAGVYTVVVSNATGSVTSNPAALALTSTQVGERIVFGTTPGKLTLTWPAGYTLQTSTSIQAGTWNSVAGGSPQTITTSSGRAFYRLIKP